jgi:hypothetical membrane protein
VIGAAIQPAGSYDAAHQTISVLAGYGAAHRWLMTTALAVVGGCHLATAAGLRAVRTSARGILVVAGAAGVLVAVFAQPAHGSSAAHIACATVSIVLLVLWPLAAGEARLSGARGVLVARIAAAVLFVLLGWLAWATRGGPLLGVAERAVIAAEVCWPLVIVLAWHRSRTTDAPR